MNTLRDGYWCYSAVCIQAKVPPQYLPLHTQCLQGTLLAAGIVAPALQEPLHSSMPGIEKGQTLEAHLICPQRFSQTPYDLLNGPDELPYAAGGDILLTWNCCCLGSAILAVAWRCLGSVQ
jgi:hypothetical protein